MFSRAATVSWTERLALGSFRSLSEAPLCVGTTPGTGGWRPCMELTFEWGKPPQSRSISCLCAIKKSTVG